MGSGFTGTLDVSFNGVSAVTFTEDSDSQITATVPDTATTGPIAVTTADGTGTSASDFTVIVAPVISSFSPMSGHYRDVITVDGTGFTGVSKVRFNGVAANFNVVSDVQIRARVPSGAGTGPISVKNAAGTDTTDSNFRFLRRTHRSKVGLDLSGHLKASGRVRVPDGTGICKRSRRVKVQRRASGHWKTIRSDLTNRRGHYAVSLPDKSGKYRAKVTHKRLANDRCKPAVSKTKTYTRPTGGGGGGGGGTCTAGYSPCLVNHGGADYDCYGGGGNGPYYTKPGVVYTVTGSDPYGLDGDNDGLGCE
jgi:hypothetical protein